MNSTSHGCWSSLKPKPVVPVNANHPLQPFVGNSQSVSLSNEAKCFIQERLRRDRKRCDNWRRGRIGSCWGSRETSFLNLVWSPINPILPNTGPRSFVATVSFSEDCSSPSADLETQNKKEAVSIHCEWPFFYRLMRRFIKGYRHKFSLQHYNTWDSPIIDSSFSSTMSNQEIVHCGGFHHSWATESTDSLLSSSRLYRERT